ncbi:DUF2184 domain-containing protein [Paracoccus sp. DMF]|uniref:DUF2184 domain-containing protein n=1 Tax=Paracoccus sp. DMF TaxID=400837 RepID=UPI001103A35D|nr:DUF2184 domain-containing protein [Paracoccus sp. DMF]MCV2448466.1 DUF2184 domain-containing protein [Paracoccus sp. DMF]
MKYQNFSDAQALAFVQGQAYRVNTRVIAQPYPSWDFGRLIYVETEGDPWAPGVLTYTSDISGAAKWQSGYAKDVPLADVSQDMQMKTFELAAIGYQWNIAEVNAARNMIVGGNLPDRRAQAARQAYMKFMWDLTWFGNAEKNMPGITNYPGVPASVAPADGTGTVPYWVDNTGVGVKTPAQIVRDINIALQGVDNATYGTVLADTVLMPDVAYTYIAGTPYSSTTMETILSFIQRTNLYTQQTGRPLTIRGERQLRTAGTVDAGAGQGRLVAYNNDPAYVKLHLPMPHNFLPVWQDGPLNFVVPGIFRTGGVEMFVPTSAYYLDGVSQAPA